MEISEVEYQHMQATIKELQKFKDTHAKSEEQEIKEYLAQRAATQMENVAKIAATKQALK